MPGKCNISNVVYRGHITRTDTGHTEHYTGAHGSAEWPVFVIAARRGNSALDDTYGHVGTRKYENQKKMMKDC